MHRQLWFPLVLAGGWLVVSCGFLAAQEASPAGAVNIRTFGGMRLVAVKRPAAKSASPGPSLMIAASDQVQPAAVQSTPYPRPPLAGFSPLVAIATSDKKKSSSNQDLEHVLESAYAGLPLNPPVETNFVVGIWDTGSVLNMVSDPYTAVVGLPYEYDGNVFPIGGVGGDIVYGDVTYPIGFFAAGLGAVDSAGQLNTTLLKGHSNVSVLGLPELSCANGEELIAVVGTPMAAFYKGIIRVSDHKEVTVGGQVFKSPSVELRTSLDSDTLAQFPRAISMTVSGGPVTTTAYYPDIFAPGGPDFDVPWIPSLLSMAAGSLGFGAAFTATVGVRQGPATPDNPVQYFSGWLVDTGAQASIISPNVASNLSLDLYNPDFTVDICGIGGTTTASGFWIDYVKINASGGALEFSRAPFVVQDVSAPDGSALSGVLGMNFFWNRDVIFDPSVSGTSFLRVGNAIPLAYGDFDRDFDVDQDDFAFFSSCSSGPGIPLSAECTLVDADGDDDVDQMDFGYFQVCLSGENVIADVNCKP